MSDEDKQAADTEEKGSDAEDKGSETEEKSSSGEGDDRVSDAETAFEEYTGDAKCPECDEPIIDVRANCPNCGYEYKEEDYGDKEAGSEFVAGSAIDDEGNEMPDDESGGGGEEASDDDDGSKDEDDSDGDDSDDK